MAGGVDGAQEGGRPALLMVATWTALAVAILALLSVNFPVPDIVRHLEGAWTATGPGGVSKQVELPGTLESMGFRSADTVVFSRDVMVGEPESGDPWAVWIERPHYQVSVSWNGELARSSGRPSDRPVFAVLPVDAHGTGRLQLTVTGAYRDGGIFDRVLIGRQSAIEDFTTHERGRRVGMAVGFALLAMMHLSVTAGRTFRKSHFFFGVMCAAGAVAAVADAAAGVGVFGDLATQLRVRGFGYAIQIGSSIGFLTAFAGRRLDPWTRAFMWACAALAVVPFVLPTAALGYVHLPRAALQAITAPWALWLVTVALRDRVPGSGWMAITLAPVALVAGINALEAGGFIPSPAPYLVPFALWVGGASAALLVRHAAESRRHRQLVTGSTDGMAISDADGFLTNANPAAVALLGTSRGANQLLSRVVDDDQPAVRAHIERATRESATLEFKMTDAQGNRVVVESHGTPVDTGRALLVLRDVTRRRRVDEGLLQAARMETLGVLVGGIAHDFNNMLGTLLGHIGILQATESDEPLLNRLGRMEASIERASLLTRRLLTLARGTGATLEPVGLSETARSATELVEPTLPPGVKLEIELAPDDPLVLGSASDLEHVIVNLLVNARDAVGPEGRLHIATRPYSHQGARGMALLVEDNGPGIPENLRQDVFAPFFTTKGPKRGSGLGLAVASQILRDHNGRIWVEQAPSGGARLLLALRHADARDEAPAPLPAGREIVLVEDEPDLRQAFTDALTRAGYHVVSFESADAAWPHLQLVQPDVLVTDVVMSGMDGIELATRFARKHVGVPILLVSGFIPDGDLQDTLEDATWTRLDKPVRSAHLVATVGRLARRAERARRGELDITQVRYVMLPLDGLTADNIGF